MDRGNILGLRLPAFPCNLFLFEPSNYKEFAQGDSGKYRD